MVHPKSTPYNIKIVCPYSTHTILMPKSISYNINGLPLPHTILMICPSQPNTILMVSPKSKPTYLPHISVIWPKDVSTVHLIVSTCLCTVWQSQLHICYDFLICIQDFSIYQAFRSESKTCHMHEQRLTGLWLLFWNLIKAYCQELQAITLYRMYSSKYISI